MPKVSPEEQARAEKVVQQARDRYHAKAVRLYEIAWRLHNLGFLAWQFELQFPIDGAFVSDKLLDAIVRYAFKYGLAPVYEPQLTSPDDSLDELYKHLRSTHDGVTT